MTRRVPVWTVTVEAGREVVRLLRLGLGLTAVAAEELLRRG